MKLHHLEGTALAIAIVASFTFAGCGGGGKAEPRDPGAPVNDESPANPPPGDIVESTPAPVDPGAPAAPVNVTATAISSGSIRIDWLDSADDESGFIVERSGASKAGAYRAIVSLPADSQTYTDSKGLAPGKTYWYRVIAERDALQSGASTVAQATTLPPTPTAPEAPAQLRASAVSDTEVDLAWTDNATDEIGFRIESSTASQGPFTHVGNAGTDVDGYRVSGLEASRRYFFRVAAYNNAGNSSYTAVIDVTTQDPPVSLPAAPGNVRATEVTENSARIVWADNADNEEGFQIGICTGLGGVDGSGKRWCASGFRIEASVPANISSYTLSGLTPDTNYTRYVRAFNSAGVSPNLPVSFRTEAGQQSLTLTPSHDNLVMISSLDNSVADNVFQSAELAVGCNWDYGFYTGTQYVCAQSLLQFELGELDGARIESAVLQLEVSYNGVGYHPVPWHLRAMASAWQSDTATWNFVESTRYHPASEQLFDAPVRAGQIYQIDVTEVVANWAAGNWQNHGFLIGPGAYAFPNYVSLDAFAFYSSETRGAAPKLTVSYR